MRAGRRPFDDLSARDLQIVTMCAVALVIGLRITIAAGLIVRLDGGARSYGDLARFWEIARAGGRPYVDYPVEYPIVTLGLFKALAAVAADQLSFGRVLIGMNLIGDLGIAAILWRSWGRGAGLFYLVASLPMVGLIDTRVDVLSTVLTVGGIALYRSRRPMCGGAFVGLAAMMKLWPAPFALLGFQRRSDPLARRYLAAVVGIGGILGVVWLALGGVEGVREVLSHRDASGWEIETLPGLALLARHPSDVVFAGGAWRVGDAGALGAPLAVVSLMAAMAATVIGTRVGRTGVAWVTGVGALLVFSTLLSPQFLIWLLPGAAIAWSEGHRRIAVLVASSALLTGIEMERLQWLVDGRPVWIWLVLARDLLLCAAVISGVVVLTRLHRTATPTVVDTCVQVVRP